MIFLDVQKLLESESVALTGRHFSSTEQDASTSGSRRESACASKRICSVQKERSRLNVDVRGMNWRLLSEAERKFRVKGSTD